MAKKKETKPKEEKPKVNKELEGFDISVNSFGEILANYDIEKINEFLNRNVDDKKLRHRDDLDTLRETEAVKKGRPEAQDDEDGK